MNPVIEFSLGVDLSQASFDAAVVPEGTDPGKWRHLAHTHLSWPPGSAEGVKALLKWVAEQCPEGRCLRVVVESTGQLSRRFAEALRGKGLPEVVIINPRRSKAYAESLGVRDKTDRVDAAILALYGMVSRCEPVQPLSAAAETLRELTRVRKGYIEVLTLWENRLREVSGKSVQAIIGKTIQELQKQIEEIDAEIERQVADDKQMAFQIDSLKKIKGIKQVSSTTLTAELGDLTTYTRSQLVGRAGLFACKFESGTSVHRRGRLAKGGCPAVRRVLYMAATSVLRSKGPLRQYGDNLLNRGLKKMEVVMALMRKLLLVCRAVMINQGNYDEKLIIREAKT